MDVHVQWNQTPDLPVGAWPSWLQVKHRWSCRVLHTRVFVTYTVNLCVVTTGKMWASVNWYKTMWISHSGHLRTCSQGQKVSCVCVCVLVVKQSSTQYTVKCHSSLPELIMFRDVPSGTPVFGRVSAAGWQGSEICQRQWRRKRRNEMVREQFSPPVIPLGLCLALFSPLSSSSSWLFPMWDNYLLSSPCLVSQPCVFVVWLSDMLFHSSYQVCLALSSGLVETQSQH